MVAAAISVTASEAVSAGFVAAGLNAGIAALWLVTAASFGWTQT
ncbi:hypothetical protein ACVWW3_005821 [Bradyrhizobium sp. LM2.9]